MTTVLFTAHPAGAQTPAGGFIPTADGTEGEGPDAPLTGLGNLIIGYNAIGNNNGDTRTGSHNLVLGDHNNYSSYGGLVAGEDNIISSRYASVSSGQNLIQSSDFGWSAGSEGTPVYGGNFSSP